MLGCQGRWPAPGYFFAGVIEAIGWSRTPTSELRTDAERLNAGGNIADAGLAPIERGIGHPPRCGGLALLSGNSGCSYPFVRQQHHPARATLGQDSGSLMAITCRLRANGTDLADRHKDDLGTVGYSCSLPSRVRHVRYTH